MVLSPRHDAPIVATFNSIIASVIVVLTYFNKTYKDSIGVNLRPRDRARSVGNIRSAGGVIFAMYVSESWRTRPTEQDFR
jgi:hypothetical protein